MVNQTYLTTLRQNLKTLPFEVSVNDMGLIQYFVTYYSKEMAKSKADFTMILQNRIENILYKYR